MRLPGDAAAVLFDRGPLWAALFGFDCCVRLQSGSRAVSRLAAAKCHGPPACLMTRAVIFFFCEGAGSSGSFVNWCLLQRDP